MSICPACSKRVNNGANKTKVHGVWAHKNHIGIGMVPKRIKKPRLVTKDIISKEQLQTLKQEWGKRHTFVSPLTLLSRVYRILMGKIGLKK